jgi:hypothetical protein
LSKGSERRPCQISHEEVQRRWEATFGPKEGPESAHKSASIAQEAREGPPRGESGFEDPEGLREPLRGLYQSGMGYARRLPAREMQEACQQQGTLRGAKRPQGSCRLKGTEHAGTLQGRCRE